MSEGQNLVNLVQAFCEAVNRHAVAEVIAMFSDEAEFELAGLYRIVGKKQIRSVFEYDAGVHTKLEFSRFQIEGNMVKCQLVERNDRLEAIGFSKLDYPSCLLTFKERRIQKFSAKPDEESMKKIANALQGFLPWLAQKYPSDRAKMYTSEGRFIYSRENGERAVPLLREWRLSQGK
jgi:limonene-1,2-epoxide hydrolase